ncbi:MAG TPA: hypothetical protein VK034_31130 [Enhygromyxa sp.]|nr:hypothetical protein [Enhygromyxa sp.]
MKHSLSVIALFGLLGACTISSDFDPGEIDFEPNRPETESPDDPAPYTGDDEIVLAAQSKFRTGIELHQKVIWRTCTPNGGVCHNSKEFPDLRTPANFVAAFGQNCNVQYGEYQSVYDRCERPGDRFKLSGGGVNTGQVEVGWIESIPGPRFEGEGLPPADSPGFHIHLADPLPGDQTNVYATGEFERTFINDGKVQDFTFAEYSTRWYILPGRRHLIAEVREYQLDQVQELLSVGIIEGDPNRNEVYGARQNDPVHLLDPGSPETSYLIARLRGEMLGEQIPGSRMPLANAPFTIEEMLALFCLVEGFPENGTEADLERGIDYASCSYSDDPAGLNLLGEGVTWSARISKILEFNCGGCHSGTAPAAELTLLGEDVYARLLEPSMQNPEMPLITPGVPEQSYLYLKLIGDDSIVGNPMPYNPLTGKGALSEAEIADVLTWITNGAVENE